jgi:hypothetical protein
MAKLGTWDTGRLQLTFLMPAAAPPNLTAVQVDGRRIAFTSTATLTYPTLRQPLEEQPLVEVFSPRKAVAVSPALSCSPPC